MSQNDAGQYGVHSELSRDLGLPTALAIGVGTMIAAGIFTLSGLAVREVGSAAIVAFLLAGGVATFTALTYCEFSSIYPRSGEGYLYARKTFQPTLAWLVGFCLILGYSASTAFYLASLSIYWQEFVYPAPWVTTSGLICLAGLTLLNMRGTKESGTFQIVVTLGKVLLLFWFVAGGLPEVDPEMLRERFSTDLLAIGATGAMVFITFFGFSAIAASAGEVRNPVQTIPRAIFWSMGIVTVLYTLVVITVLAADLSTYGEAAMGVAAERFLGPVGLKVIVGGALFSMVSASNASIMAGSRVAMAMAQLGHLPKPIGRIHPRTRTPVGAVLLVSLLIGIFTTTLGTRTGTAIDTIELTSQAEQPTVVLSQSPVDGSIELRHQGQIMDPSSWSHDGENNQVVLHLEEDAPPLLEGTLEASYTVFKGVEQLAHYADTVLLLVLIVVNAGLIVHRRRFPEIERPFRVAFVPLLPGLGIVANLYLLSQLAHHPEPVLLALGTLGSGLLFFVLTRPKEQPIPLDIPTTQVALERPTAHPHTFRVLVPIANPSNLDSLLDLACSIASPVDGEIVLSRVLVFPEQVPPRVSPALIEPELPLLDAAQEHCSKNDVEASALVVAGYSVENAILDTVQQRHCNLIVMGWKGYTSHRERLLGKAMDRVLRGTDVDTLVMKRSGNEPVRRILLPTAGGPHALKAARYARKLALFLDGHVTVLRILPTGATDADLASADQELEALHLTLEGVEAGYKVIQSDEVVHTIVEEGKGHDAIMLGATGNRRKALFGNIPVQVAKQSEKTVLVLKTSG